KPSTRGSSDIRRRTPSRSLLGMRSGKQLRRYAERGELQICETAPTPWPTRAERSRRGLALKSANDVVLQIGIDRVCTCRKRADHDVGPRTQPRRRLEADCLETTPNGIARHGVADCLAYDETEARRT